VKLKTTPLNRIHHRLGARMIDFAGWEMPVQYESALTEHHRVRQAVGVFDVSHMGRFEVTGRDALAFVQRMTCNDVARLSDGQAQYSAFLTPEGTFIDDIVVYRFDAQRVFICVNAATCAKDYAWLLEHRSGQCNLVDRSSEYAQLAVQGPRAIGVLQKLTPVDLSAIKFYWFTEGQIAGVRAILSRTGYTGEPGYELYVPAEVAEKIWEAVFEAGKPADICPAGLACRNSLRLEMKYPLYGNDIDETTTPYEAGLGWIVKLGTGFIGEDVLERQKSEGVARRLVGFQMVDPGIARDGFPVFLDGDSVGHATSGGFSPSLGKSIGLVYLPVDRSTPGTEIEIEIRGKHRRAQVVKTPFYQPERV